MNDQELLRLAAAVERGSEHPLASAILKAAGTRGIAIPPATDFATTTGRRRERARRRTPRGSRTLELLESRQVDPGALAARADALRQDGQTVLFVAIDDRVAGVIAVADPIRPSTAEAVRLLKEDGLRLVMLTGDSRITAAAIASRLGIDDVRAEVLPAGKRAVVEELQRGGASGGDGG